MDFASDLTKALLGLGPGGVISGVFFYLWKQERDERQRLQQQNVDLLKETANSRNALAGVLERIAIKVGA